MKNITIVDDALDLGRVLQTMLLTLDSKLSISVVPSGEEAILDSGRRPVDLLITDIRLPGMSGLELIKRIRSRHPVIKVIIISGTSDDRVIRQASDLHTEGFFSKPLDFTQFLDVARACLGLPARLPEEPAIRAADPFKPFVEPATRLADPFKPSAEPARPAVAPPKPAVEPAIAAPAVLDVQPAEPTPLHRLTDLVVGLRQSLGAQAVLVLNDVGHALVQAGDWPQLGQDPEWVPALFSALSAAERVSRLSGADGQALAQGYSGTDFDLVLAPLGLCALLVVQKKGRSALRLALTVEELLATQKELAQALADLRAPQTAPPADLPQTAPLVPPGPASLSTAITPPAPLPEPIALEPEPGLDQFLSMLDQQSDLPVTADVDAFWQDQTSGATAPASSNILTYEEAARLGLTPPPPDKK